MRRYPTVILALLLSLGLVGPAAGKDVPGERLPVGDCIGNFEQVDATLYRGAQPKEACFAKLKAMGIRTVVNFRREKKAIEKERQLVESLGMRYVSIPWHITRRPKDEIYRKFFAVTDDPEAQPVFYHCMRGVERTGTMTAAYKRRAFSFSADSALRDIKRFCIRWYWYPFVRSHVRAFDPAQFPKPANAKEQTEDKP